MAKLTLNNVSSSYRSQTAFNANFDAIEAAIENTLSLDGTAPNAMTVNHDLGSNRIINVADPVNNQDGATKAYVDSLADTIADINAITQADGTIIVSDGTDWVGESGATARTSLGLAIGTDVQAYDAGLADIAALAVTDGNIIVGDGANWVAESGATARASLGLVIGTDVQAYDAELAAIAGLTSAANKIPYFTGSEVAGTLDLLDEDDMSSDSASGVPTQQSVKAYVDAQNAEQAIVTPEDYSAAGDNSTDDTTALQNAINGAITNNAVLIIPDGKTYRTTSALSIPANANIAGFGAIRSDHTGNGMELASGASNVSLRDFELYGDAADVTITAATQANPVVITLSSGHGLANGDRLRVPPLTAGMTELGGRSFELNNKLGDTFELRENVLGFGLTNVDGTGYTAWSGSTSCVSYAAARIGHRGIYGQSALFNNGVNATYFENIRLQNVRVHNFGAEGVRIDFVKGLEVIGCDIHDCATHGVLSLSPRHYNIAENKLHDIGPGDSENNAGYGVSVSRVKTYTDATLGAGTEASLADSPRPYDGRIADNRIYRIEDYAAIDTHSCDGAAITGNTVYDVALGYNFEHHSSAGVLAPSENVTVSGNSFKGTTGTYNSVGPAIAIDTRSGGGEVGKGVTITGNSIEGFGHRGNNPIFLSSGAIYARDTEGMVIVGNAFNGNHGRDIYLNTGNANFVIAANASTDLNTADSVRNMVDIAGTSSNGSVSNNRYENASGNAYNDDSNGTIDLLEFNGNRVITKDRVGNFTQLNSDNMRLDGNTLSSTDINGAINITPDGSGTTRITGLVNIGSGGAPGYELDIVDGSDTAFRIWATDNIAGADTFLRQLVTHTSASNYLYFGDGLDQDAGILQYRHSDDKFRITAGATLTLELDNADADFYTNVNVSTGHGFQVNGTQVLGAQESGTGETVGFTAGAGTAVNDDSTFTGNVGATAYRISDIVKALKNHGLIAP